MLTYLSVYRNFAKVGPNLKKGGRMGGLKQNSIQKE